MSARLALAAVLMLAAVPALAEDPDPVETRLVQQAQAAQTQEQNFIEAVKALVDARAKDKAQLAALQTWVHDYIAGLKAAEPVAQK
ncbi:MAG TPA: hypothetical protein VHY35_13780 [Stellaceae bacterium]|jgi:hypothetical protein|nr:hypothetical protein [Stellaceae bacterium]